MQVLFILEHNESIILRITLAYKSQKNSFKVLNVLIYAPLSCQVGLSASDNRISREHLEGARLSSSVHTEQPKTLTREHNIIKTLISIGLITTPG